MNLIEKIKYKLPNILLLVFFLGMGILVLNLVSYLDILNLCLINIEGEVITGNEKTIKQAIRLIKKSDSVTYRNLCRNVRTIKERYCLIAEVPIRYGTEPGCYIRGSKVIYLIPEKKETSEIVKSRAATILKYAEKSQKFWSQKNL